MMWPKIHIYKNIDATMRVDMTVENEKEESGFTTASYYVRYKCDGDNERASQIIFYYNKGKKIKPHYQSI